MTYFSAILLGIVHGLTEFLPISSTAHMYILNNIFSVPLVLQEHLFFNVLLNFGTLFSVCIVFRRDARAMLGEIVTMIEEAKDRQQPPGGSFKARRLLLLLLISCVPILLFSPLAFFVDNLSLNSSFLGLIFLLTGVLIAITDKFTKSEKNTKTMQIKDAVIIGLCQAASIIPGFSRSALTIGAGISTGLDRGFAVKYAFLLSIPTILITNIVRLISAISQGFDVELMPVYLAGMVVASFIGILTIGFVKHIVQSLKFGIFSYYCWTIGIVTLILSLIF